MEGGVKVNKGKLLRVIVNDTDSFIHNTSAATSNLINPTQIICYRFGKKTEKTHYIYHTYTNTHARTYASALTLTFTQAYTHARTYVYNKHQVTTVKWLKVLRKLLTSSK